MTRSRGATIIAKYLLAPRLPFLALVLAAAWTPARADGVWVRWNQAGYVPQRPKQVVVMSDTDLRGQSWTLRRDSRVVLSGIFGASFAGRGEHTAKPFHYKADLSTVTAAGDYLFEAPGAAPAAVRVVRDPYRKLISQALRHLRVERSGSAEALLHAPSHAGDRAAIVSQPKEPAQGTWKQVSPRRTVNMTGGWYDAGDYIKFTLNEAYVVYHLLLAWHQAPNRFPRVLSKSELPDLLDEARFGLRYLLKTFPDPNTFVIQVGTQEDHNQGDRLPEDDMLDGKRKALCAISRTQMGVTAAALALGARTFAELGRRDEAQAYRAKAVAIFERARQPDAVTTAFERDEVNDFYRDETDADNMALAAAQLYFLTREPRYLDAARALAPPPAKEVSWDSYNFLANYALGAVDPAAADRALAEAAAYRDYADGHPWGLPGGYTWASLHRWIGMANACRSIALQNRDAGMLRTFDDVLDYVFGRNPWGVSFFASPDLPNTVRGICNPIYQLLHEFPVGALSEGPGDVAEHQELEKYFTPPAGDDPLAQFNTPAAVFRDDPSDFMLQEATIGGQSDILLMLTLAQESERARKPASRAQGGPTSLFPPPAP